MSCSCRWQRPSRQSRSRRGRSGTAAAHSRRVPPSSATRRKAARLPTLPHTHAPLFQTVLYRQWLMVLPTGAWTQQPLSVSKIKSQRKTRHLHQYCISESPSWKTNVPADLASLANICVLGYRTYHPVCTETSYREQSINSVSSIVCPALASQVSLGHRV